MVVTIHVAFFLAPLTSGKSIFPESGIDVFRLILYAAVLDHCQQKNPLVMGGLVKDTG